ncbi:hypothetical protein ACFXAW_01200 [Streptomyces sp. NPDC059445]|uniref:hypothetical protein n=1 Tax=Streptomyces sp. NPDC059445 TaxID=3346832 RepID=UPI00367449EC
MSSMVWWQGLLWGLAGAISIEALDLYGAIRRIKGYPWKFEGEVPFGPYMLSIVIRLGVGAGLATALASSGQIAGPIGGLAAGIAAPKIIEQLARRGLGHSLVEAPPTAQLPGQQSQSLTPPDLALPAPPAAQSPGQPVQPSVPPQPSETQGGLIG